jgi:transposase, IS30 family
MDNYSRISYQERCLIETGVRSRKSRRAIAKSIGRPPKTVGEEIDRNGGYLGYYAAQAEFEKTRSNRAGYSKIEAIPGLPEYIRCKLKERWSPESIAAKWNQENGDSTISHESIYAWVYKQEDDLYLSLSRKKKKRGLKPQRSKSKIPNRTSIHVRPEHINNRSEIGHYEADLVFQKGNQSQNILSLVERKSRMIVLIKNNSKHSEVVMKALKNKVSKHKYPVHTITFDNGSEFTNHSELGIDTYFCDPGSPWQKGAIENVNGILRTYLDYRINPETITQEMLDSIAEHINNKPRKILNFLTPNEAAQKIYNENLEGVTFYS